MTTNPKRQEAQSKATSRFGKFDVRLMRVHAQPLSSLLRAVAVGSEPESEPLPAVVAALVAVSATAFVVVLGSAACLRARGFAARVDTPTARGWARSLGTRADGEPTKTIAPALGPCLEMAQDARLGLDLY